MIFHVASASDPRLAPYLGVKERDLVQRDGRFIVEGKVTVERLIENSSYPIESLFLSESRIEPLTDLLAKLDPAVPVYMAPQSVMDQTAGFHLHRGVLALARREAELSCEELIASLAQNDPLTLLTLI